MKRMSQKYIITLIRKVIPDTKRIYLMGSRAKGTHKADSDWDVRVIIPSNKIHYRKYQWHNYQANIDGKVLSDFDVGELDAPKLDVFVCDYMPDKSVALKQIYPRPRRDKTVN